jgi:hypothetical protein
MKSLQILRRKKKETESDLHGSIKVGNVGGRTALSGMMMNSS